MTPSSPMGVLIKHVPPRSKVIGPSYSLMEVSLPPPWTRRLPLKAKKLKRRTRKKSIDNKTKENYNAPQ